MQNSSSASERQEGSTSESLLSNGVHGSWELQMTHRQALKSKLWEKNQLGYITFKLLAQLHINPRGI